MAFRRAFSFLFGAVSFVPLIVCVNLTSLMLARDAGRRREFAMRAAIGARAWDLAVRPLVESLALSMAGGFLGLALGLLLMGWLGIVAHLICPAPRRSNLDSRVLLFVTATSLLCGIICA